MDEISFRNLSKQNKFEKLNPVIIVNKGKEKSIKKEINQIVQNIFYDVSADVINFSNLSGYQKYVIKSAAKDNDFLFIACKFLIICLTEFIKVSIL